MELCNDHIPDKDLEAIGPAVKIKDAVFRYGAKTVLETSSVNIPAGQITALIGPNGAGKSTFLNAIAGLIHPVSGQVEMGCCEGRTYRTSYVLQETKVNATLPVTVQEVVSMGRYANRSPWRMLTKDDRERVAEAMERTNVTHLARRHLSRLSGGERHRVLLAQGLAQDHDVLLLDEPATGLDVVSAQAVRNTIHSELVHGCTVIVATHNLGEAWEADYVVLLSGRVVVAGSPGEVFQAHHMTAAYGMGLLNAEGNHLFLDDPHHVETGEHYTHVR
ncbi:MAG: metal ABC transporter ATP-binding protein [bacterium]|nr:metal ABC transporter ATP-binding protein [bacterium]